jgi:spermidine/putrescine transport system permease protein
MNHRGTKLLAWPAIGYLAILFAIPTLLVLSYSVLDRDFYGGVRDELSWEAWRQATDWTTLKTITRTLLLAASVTLVDLVVAYPCAMALSRMPREQRTLWVLLLGFPMVTSLLLRTFGWMNIMPLAWRGTFSGVGLVLACTYLPFMVLPLVKAFERADATLVAAALDLGATPWQAFWRVTFPITRSGMLAGSALVFIPASGEYLIPHFIGNGKVDVVGTLIMRLFEQRNWPFAAACAVWLAAIVLVPLGAWTLTRTGAPAIVRPAKPRRQAIP